MPLILSLPRLNLFSTLSHSSKDILVSFLAQATSTYQKKNRSFSCITGANYPIFALASKMHPMNINVTPAICASLSLFTWDSYPSFSTRHAHIILI